MKIIYPQISTSSLCIGVTAPSSGLGTEAFVNRFEFVKKQHEQKGITIVEGDCLRENKEHVSGPSLNRARDFLQMWNDPKIDLIHPPWGGAVLIDLLEKIDFGKLSQHPKWIQGYSDTSTLLFAITTITGIATAHGTNFMDFIEGQDDLTANSRSYLKLKYGETWTQISSLKWAQKLSSFSKQTDAKFNLTGTTEWKVLKGRPNFKGRIIGGCADTLKHLVGTPYGNLPFFAKNYAKDDGVILFLENCDQDPLEFYRALYSMKYAGWFDGHIQGVILGRNNAADHEEFPYQRSVEEFFSSLDFPVIYDADIGHKPPQMTIINGSLAHLTVENGKAILEQTLI